MRRAIKAIRDAGFTPEKLEGIANFTRLPRWYYEDTLKGVHDVDRISDRTREIIALLRKKQKTRITRAIRKLGWEAMIETANTDADESSSAIAALPRKRDRGDVLSAVEELRSVMRNYNISSASEIIQYLASSGGFFALAPTLRETLLTREFREALKFAVTRAIDKGLVQFHTK
jgi:hypothetical protein